MDYSKKDYIYDRTSEVLEGLSELIQMLALQHEMCSDPDNEVKELDIEELNKLTEAVDERWEWVKGDLKNVRPRSLSQLEGFADDYESYQYRS